MALGLTVFPSARLPYIHWTVYLRWHFVVNKEQRKLTASMSFSSLSLILLSFWAAEITSVLSFMTVSLTSGYSLPELNGALQRKAHNNTMQEISKGRAANPPGGLSGTVCKKCPFFSIFDQNISTFQYFFKWPSVLPMELLKEISGGYQYYFTNVDSFQD